MKLGVEKLPRFGPLFFFFWGGGPKFTCKKEEEMNDIDSLKLGGGGAKLPKLPSWGQVAPLPPASLFEDVIIFPIRRAFPRIFFLIATLQDTQSSTIQRY